MTLQQAHRLDSLIERRGYRAMERAMQIEEIPLCGGILEYVQRARDRAAQRRAEARHRLEHLGYDLAEMRELVL